MENLDKVFVGLVATANALTPVETQWLSLELTTAYFGVPLNVFAAAAFGSLVAVMKERKQHGDVLVVFFGSLILSLFLSAVGPLVVGKEWPNTGIQAIATMLLGYTSQSYGGIFMDEIGPAIKEFLRRFRPYKKDDET